MIQKLKLLACYSGWDAIARHDKFRCSLFPASSSGNLSPLVGKKNKYPRSVRARFWAFQESSKLRLSNWLQAYKQTKLQMRLWSLILLLMRLKSLNLDKTKYFFGVVTSFVYLVMDVQVEVHSTFMKCSSFDWWQMLSVQWKSRAFFIHALSISIVAIWPTPTMFLARTPWTPCCFLIFWYFKQNLVLATQWE